MKSKVFCIGRNKTGTTSLERALGDLGYRMGEQARGERLFRDWVRGDFEGVIELGRSADAFQDVPFSLPETFRTLDQVFPDSRFVLTVRSSAQEWYDSLVRFHTQIVGKGRRPTADDLKSFDYNYRGYLWEVQRDVYGIREGQEYDPDIYKAHYERHNATIRRYFQGRPESLLELNLARPAAMERLCAFLRVEGHGLTMPHLNRTR